LLWLRKCKYTTLLFTTRGVNGVVVVGPLFDVCDTCDVSEA
jgi:hypothetical protein